MMRSKAEPSLRISHQKWQTGPLQLFQEHPPPTHTHYIYVRTVTHTYEEKRNYITHQLFLFTSPVEINPTIQKPVVRVQGLLQAVREKAHSL